MIYYTPGLKVFIDDRCELYGDAWLAKFWEAMRRDRGQIESWDNRYRFQYALVHYPSAFDRYFERASDWAVVTRTDTATLFRGRTNAVDQRLFETY